MAFPLNAAQERMAEGMAIGDAVQLVHVTNNDYDANAIEVRWRDQWIGLHPDRAGQRGRARPGDQR